MIASFESFFAELTSDEIWYDGIQVKYTNKDLRSIAQDCYLDLLAQPNRWKAQDYSDFRRCYQKWVMNAKPMAVKPQLQQVEVKENKPDPNYKILEGEERTKRIKEWEAAVLAVDNNFRVPQVSKKEAAEEGDWLPKKQAPYNPPPAYITLVNENIKKFAAKKYKGLRYIDGFKRFGFGEVSVLAENEQDAKEIIKKAERLSKLQMTRL